MPPVTLSKQQFGATAAGKKAGSSYEGYLGYIARHRAAKLAAAPTADPLAQTSPTDINSIVNKYTSGYGPTLTDPQIQSSAQAQIDPIIAAITSKIQGTAKESGAQIAANSAALAKALGGIDYAAPYAGAQRDQAAVDAALQQSLNGGGAALAGDLKSRLGMIGDPTVSAAADSVGARGTAIGTNELASGSANLGSLIASAAAAKSYGQKMPGIAQLSGLQDIAGVGKEATTKVGDATTQIMQLLPQIVSSLRSERDNKTGNKASLAAQLYQTLTGQNVTKATAQAGLQNTAFDNGLAYANTFGVDPSTGQTVKGYHLDAKGNVVKNATPKAPKALTVTDRKKLVSDLDTFYYGVPPKQHFDSKTSTWIDVPNTGTPALSYTEAVRNLMDGYGLTEQAAVKYANTRYKPGEDGRPKSAGQKKTDKAVASGVGIPKTTGPFSGLGSVPSKSKAPPLIIGSSPTKGKGYGTGRSSLRGSQRPGA